MSFSQYRRLFCLEKNKVPYEIIQRHFKRDLFSLPFIRSIFLRLSTVLQNNLGLLEVDIYQFYICSNNEPIGVYVTPKLLTIRSYDRDFGACFFKPFVHYVVV